MYSYFEKNFSSRLDCVIFKNIIMCKVKKKNFTKMFIPLSCFPKTVPRSTPTFFRTYIVWKYYHN